jgi:hypothetical protein
LQLVDRLTCPRCGPAFGVVLLAERVVERRVLDGWLGCPNCRDRFRVADGFGDLRAPPRDELSEEEHQERAFQPTATGATRLAAFLGVAEGPAHVALVGHAVATYAAALADLIAELEVAAVSPTGRSDAERTGVSRMVSAPGLAFQSSSLRAVALDSDAPEALLREAARVVAPSGRVVLAASPPDAADQLKALGLHTLLDQDRVVVAEKPGPRPPSTGGRLPIVS